MTSKPRTIPALIKASKLPNETKERLIQQYWKEVKKERQATDEKRWNAYQITINNMEREE